MSLEVERRDAITEAARELLGARVRNFTTDDVADIAATDRPWLFDGASSLEMEELAAAALFELGRGPDPRLRHLHDECAFFGAVLAPHFARRDIDPEIYSLICDALVAQVLLERALSKYFDKEATP